MSKTERDIAYIKKELKHQGMLLEKLANSVCGDEEFGQTGLIQQVNGHHRYIEEDKKFKNKIIGGVTVITSIWGVIIAGLMKFWSN